MERNAKIYIAGHRGLVGSALQRALLARGFGNLLTRTHAELDLTDAQAVQQFFSIERPEYVFLAAAKVGGIIANNTLPGDFIRENLAIQSNVIQYAHKHQARRLLFLGSNCIYPKAAAQPITEADLLTGELEPTNRPYAIAKIAGVEMCWAYNRQYKTRYLSVMPINLYGPGDNYHSEHSHVLPALIRRFHEAQQLGAPEVTVWGSGTPMREFMYSDDMADACIFLLELPDLQLQPLLAQDRNAGTPPLVNIGAGSDLSIAELARKIAKVVGYQGEIRFDVTKPDGTHRKLLDTRVMDGLGWKPKVSLDHGLTMAYADFRKGATRL